jgi:hypothetical protein
MGRFFAALVSIILTVAAASSQTVGSVSVSHDGWTVTADAERNVLSIMHEKLGAVMKDARLNLEGERGLRPLDRWSAEKKAENQLSVKTVEPRTAWLVELGPNVLKISSTSAQAVVTAQVPASADRIVARLLDFEGVPASWVGTNEVVDTYGGSETRNPSFLPRRNPEVMYFSLGQVSSANLHALFDRKTDTAIDFSDQTMMKRNNHDQGVLDVTVPVPGNTLLRLVPDYYTRTLGLPFYVPFDDTYFSRPPMIWCSWTSHYDEVGEEDIIRNADWIAAHLKPYGFQYVQLDDGYDRGRQGEHYWIENWDRVKFPHGPQWLASYIKSKGLRPGLWLVPNAYAGAVEQHPEWYLRDHQGRIIRDYSTPALDSTNPEVLAFLKKLFTTLGSWGFEYYKFDGEHALPKYVPGVDRDKLYDKSVDPIVAYRNRLKLIRETIGPHTFVEGCPAGTPLNGVGYFNSTFAGHDVYNSWQGMYPLFSSINANAFLNHIVVYLMPGEGIDVGPRLTVEEAKQKRYPSFVATARTREEPMVGFGTTLAEARTLVTYVALTGVAYPLASVLPELPDERVRLLKMTLPTLPILPVDLFSRGTDMEWEIFKRAQPDYYIHNYPEVLDLKVNSKSGVYDVVGLTNWRSGTVTRELSFAEKLGLDTSASYVAFDFWGQKLLGVFKDRMKVAIEPHDTRVLLLHPVLNHPELVGTSRHITGAYSVLELEWDAAKSQLRGSSQTVAGDPYTLWVYVPKGVMLSQVRVATKRNPAVPVRHKLTRNSLEVTFEGQPEVVDWKLDFATKTAQ